MGPTLPESGSFIFTDTDFIECKNPGSESYGGAIDCTGGDLTIQRCSFAECSSGFRGGGTSFRSGGTCIQEDNLYLRCSAGSSSGGFDSWHTSKSPYHHHKRCKYIQSTSDTRPHIIIEYSPDVRIDSTIYIQGTSDGSDWAGTVVCFHANGPIIYSNCIFSHGNAFNSGGLSFLGSRTDTTATLTVKFCFFINNYDLNGKPREIYFNADTSCNAGEDLIIHSFSATPGSTVFIQNESPQDQYWLL